MPCVVSMHGLTLRRVLRRAPSTSRRISTTFLSGRRQTAAALFAMRPRQSSSGSTCGSPAWRRRCRAGWPFIMDVRAACCVFNVNSSTRYLSAGDKRLYLPYSMLMVLLMHAGYFLPHKLVRRHVLAYLPQS